MHQYSDRMPADIAPRPVTNGYMKGGKEHTAASVVVVQEIVPTITGINGHDRPDYI